MAQNIENPGHLDSTATEQSESYEPALMMIYKRGKIFMVERELQNSDHTPFSSNAFNRLKEKISEYTTQLITESVKVARRHQSESVSTSDVERASQYLVSSTSRKVYRHMGTLGGITAVSEDKYASEITEDAQIAQIRKNLDISKLRLGEEVKSLSKRNSLNLKIGVITTALAVGMLIYLVLGTTQQTFSNIPDLLAHFIPRVSVAAFIEVFSFFFLKLYKAGLQEIKYFQNELTNVEMKGLAIETTLMSAQNKTTEMIIPQLVSIDRNLSASNAAKIAHNTGKQLSAKEIVDLLDKIGKLVGSKS